ncbi:putative peptidase S10 family protein [Lyophyllum shimeji]|uniref:Carboxypeptidase n=1 Tax=Lyophyllum shimeji TaxID=47721 RepID=A0A9P3PII0_LYOSH|nr:putative peptidase S10 family protein [Lyophyllum shimeji]
MAYDEGLFTPLEDLSVLSETEFTQLSHPAFPDHGVRIKKTPFCDHTVKSYTGYIDIETRHLFFYFFESRTDPDKDDVIMWTNGGPGCSSSLGLLMELGPCRIAGPNSTKSFEHAWNSKANVFFIDQPAGVGYSYTDYKDVPGTTEDAAKDIAAFVAIFFEHFTKFKGRAFHMAGESYGGRYIPLFASEVYDQNARLIEAGITPINLTSAIIGNGWTDAPSMVLSYFDMQCTPASLEPILDIATCVRMQRVLPRCQQWVQQACVDTFDAINCNAAFQFCSSELTEPFIATGRNPYDISKPCEGDSGDLCYPITKNISAYLSNRSTHRLLGVDRSAHPSNYSLCSSTVADAFAATLDSTRPTTPLYVAGLLERGVRVLVYVGTYDWICNWVGNERWTRELAWSGREEFVTKELRVWEVDENRAGRTRAWGPLTFATVEGAGHMVPYDKPKEALELVNRWMAGQEL